jgi:dipeptidyl aminopeptidase/acylaminoacyl peptidase
MSQRLLSVVIASVLAPCWASAQMGDATREFKHGSPIAAVSISPDGKRLASAGWDKTVQTVRIWDVATGKEVHACTGHEAEIECLAFSPDGKLVASGAWDKTVRLWDVQTGKEVRQMGPHPDGILSLAFSPDGKLLATGNQDRMAQQGTLHLWEVASGKAVRTIAGHALPVTALAFSTDGRRLATGSVDKTVRLFEVDTGKELARFQGHEGWVQAVAFAPDGLTLASAGADKLVRLWDIAAAKQRYLFEGHTDKVRTLAYSVDGRTIVSGSFDKTIRFWETATGKQRLLFAGHKAGVRSLVYAPDGRHLASGGSDGVVRLLDIVALIHEGQPPKETLAAKDLDDLWTDLASADVPRSYRALGTLAGAAQQAVPFLQDKLGPAASADEKRLAALIADLDNGQFLVRERASQALYNLGDLAVPALKAALEGERSVEARRRIEEILQRLQGPVTSPERMRPLRAVEALEQMGTPAARKVLEALAKGAAEAWLTREARASLDRLAKRPID